MEPPPLKNWARAGPAELARQGVKWLGCHNAAARLRRKVPTCRSILLLFRTPLSCALVAASAPLAHRSNPARAGWTTFRPTFWVRRPDCDVRVPVERIEWIEAAKDYVLLHTERRSYLYRAKMRELQAKLDPRELTRVHRSAFGRLDRAVKCVAGSRASCRPCRTGKASRLGRATSRRSSGGLVRAMLGVDRRAGRRRLGEASLDAPRSAAGRLGPPPPHAASVQYIWSLSVLGKYLLELSA